jgi:hypothetical protein
MEHRSFIVHTSRGEVHIFVNEDIAQVIPLDAEGVAQKEPLEEYRGVDELADLLIRHAELPEAEARRIAEELLSRRAVMIPLAWRFWKREERRRAKALFEFSSN